RHWTLTADAVRLRTRSACGQCAEGSGHVGVAGAAAIGVEGLGREVEAGGPLCGSVAVGSTGVVDDLSADDGQIRPLFEQGGGIEPVEIGRPCDEVGCGAGADDAEVVFGMPGPGALTGVAMQRLIEGDGLIGRPCAGPVEAGP